MVLPPLLLSPPEPSLPLVASLAPQAARLLARQHLHGRTVIPVPDDRRPESDGDSSDPSNSVTGPPSVLRTRAASSAAPTARRRRQS